MAIARIRNSWLGNIPVQGKIAVVIGGLLLLYVISVAASTVALWRDSIAQADAERMAALTADVSGLRRAAGQREMRLIQAIVAPGRATLTAYQASAEAVKAAAAKARESVAAEPAILAQVERAAHANERWIANVQAPAVAFVEQAIADGAPSTDRVAALEEIMTHELGESGTIAITAILDEAMAVASAQLRRSREEAERVDSLLDWVNAIALIMALVGSGAAIYLTSILVATPLRDLADRMGRLAAHDHSIDVPQLERRDEVGTIARALQVFKQMAIATHESDWVKTGVNAISADLQQVGDVRAFAGHLVSALAPLVEAGVAVFYLADEEGTHLTLCGTYGYQERRHLTTQYRFGQGLVGQCALERKPIALAPVPDDYVRIHSGTGEANPRAILVVPIASSERLLGVLEIASFAPLTGRARRLVDDVAPVVALSLENLSRAERTRLLLDETQRQATELRVAEEELRTQQEELRTTNDQLQQQSQRLAASEEELRVQAEELQRSNVELRNNADALEAQKTRLEELQQETQARADDLAKANQYKSQFLANMSHELRTPLNSLLILSHDLAENRGGNLLADQVESATIIHDSGSNLLRLINEILDLSKVEAGKVDVSHDTVEPKDMARRMERHFRRLAEEKGISFTVSVAPEAPERFMSDAGKLEQITNNLLGNAFKFTTTGGVTVTLGAGPADGVTVEVRDSGIGIPPEKLETIFEAFEQVDASTRRQYGGTGLGLAISRRLAQLLGGDVSVDSVLGQGATFRLTLPSLSAVPVRAAPAAPAVEHKPMPAVPRAPVVAVEDDRDGLKPGVPVILVVEDDPVFARTLVGIVRRKGYHALAAGDGEAGLGLARAHKPTGILLDVMLPGMDGWTVIERLKADPATRHIPVHFVSALDEGTRGRDLGAVGFLTKPVSAEALSGALDRLMHFSSDRPRRVLTVDDDPGARLAVRTLLARSGAEILEAESGEAALELLKGANVDCIVLDLGLPGMSGFEFLEHLSDGAEAVPVVVYSARDLTAEESLRLRAYTDSIVVKGAFTPERLLDEVSLFLHSVQHEPRAVPQEPDGDLSGRRVLLVDDDMRNVFALAKVLRGKGIEVRIAQDGAKAIATLHEHPDTELVLMDIMMPVMDGYEAMTAIRGEQRFAHLPMIALTAKAMSGDREKCLAAGASDYLSKPIDVPKLLSMMRSWLRPR